MGGGISRRKKQLPLVPRPPLKTCDEVMRNTEARERVGSAIKIVSPGIPFRWEKVLAIINRKKEPTEEEPDPLNVDIDFTILKEIMEAMFHEVKFITQDGLGMARDLMPKLFDKHTPERGSRVSNRYREQKNMSDEWFAYGELDYDIFATMYLKIIAVYSARDEGVFYDLGCGVGTLVFTAAFIGKFIKVSGVEIVTALLERGEKRMMRWNKLKENFTNKIKAMEFEWNEDDFVVNTYWTNGTFIFLHWTAFPLPLRKKMAQAMSACIEGTHVITFTHPIPSTDFVILLSDTCDTSWGKVEFFFHEKVTPAKKGGS